MKRFIGTPIKAIAFITLLAGIFSFFVSLWLLFFGLSLLGIGGFLYLIDVIIFRKARSRRKMLFIEVPFTVAYIITWFFAIMAWQAHSDIIFPQNFKGEAGIIFGIEGYPPLPKSRFWKKEIRLPEDGILITSTKQEDLPHWFKFKKASGEEYSLREIQLSNHNSFPCLNGGKEIVYFSIRYTIGQDSSFRLQRKVVSLCNQINEGKGNTIYSGYDPIISNVDKPYLHLQDKGLAYLPDAVADLQIKEAILTGNDFTSIPKSIFKNQSIESLLIGHNPITDIPQEIYQLKNLKRLVLNSTRIRNITTDLSGLDSLQSFDLSTNELDSLPKQVYNIPHLKELMIENNRFKNFSFVNARLNQLEVLYVYSNRIENITKETKHLSNLKDLQIFSNHWIAFQTI
ncbi:MAG TPA: leucine-rich repeat domain-containing protein [Chondromyces sp.]|nr:leucine-rich repeat domain-containing protein [Chondromyces sp.]